MVMEYYGMTLRMRNGEFLAFEDQERVIKGLMLLHRAEWRANMRLQKKVAGLEREKKVYEQEKRALERRVIYADVLCAAQQSFSFSEMVRLFHEAGMGIGQKAFTLALKEMGMVSRRDGRTPTKQALVRGYLTVCSFVKAPGSAGVVTLGSMVRITEKGQRYFFKRMLAWRAKQHAACKRLS